MWYKVNSSAFHFYHQVTQFLNQIASFLPSLLLRIILAIEFGTAGLEKFNGSNWFSTLTFPFPFSLLPSEISWTLATYFEIFGAIALIIGFATRFFSFSLFILTIVAIASVHWASEIRSLSDLFEGYRIIDEEGDGLGNYKLPLIYLVMMLPLIFGGAGKFSLDYLINKTICKDHGCAY